MTNIESKKVTVNRSSADVFTFLCDLNNLHDLLPQGKISDWSGSVDQCSFKVQGAYTIVLGMKENHANNKVILESRPGSPFPFTLNIFLEENGGSTNVWQVCNADINAFLEMIVKGPLKNLFDYMADKLVEKFQA